MKLLLTLSAVAAGLFLTGCETTIVEERPVYRAPGAYYATPYVRPRPTVVADIHINDRHYNDNYYRSNSYHRPYQTSSRVEQNVTVYNSKNVNKTYVNKTKVNNNTNINQTNINKTKVNKTKVNVKNPPNNYGQVSRPVDARKQALKKDKKQDQQ
jgi:hypothetical protein